MTGYGVTRTYVARRDLRSASAPTRQDFRSLMDTARAAAAELAADREIEVTQRGDVVDIAQARGPIRLRRRRGQDSAPGMGDL